MRPLLLTLAVILLVTSLGLAILLGRGVRVDESVVFLPVQRSDRAVLTIRGEARLEDVRHERVSLGGERIAITTIGPNEGPLIISCFGNASDRVEMGMDYGLKLRPFGQALLWDYPGYGDSSGLATVESVERVAADLVPWIEAKALDRPIVYWGHSLGGFVCANLAFRTDNVAAIVLETTAPSVQSVARAWTPKGLPLRVGFDEDLLRFDIPKALSGVKAPILILGAGRDRVLPVSLSRELSDYLPHATYLELPDATHFSAGFDPKAQLAVRNLLGGL